MARRSIFISYAHADRPEVEESAALLRAGGVRVFVDVRDIDYGERWKDALKTALDQCERVMVFWSLAAQASEWVEREWRYALALGKRIVPALLDHTPLPDELAQFQAVPRFRQAAGAGPRGPVPAVERAQPRHARPRRTLLAAAAAAAIATLGGVAFWALRPTPAGDDRPGAGPMSPLPQAPALADRFAQARSALLHAGEVVADPMADERALDDARLALQRHVGENLRDFSRLELESLALAAESSRQRLEALRQQLAAGKVSAETPGELRAFLALAEEVETTVMRLRLALAAAPAERPASAASSPPARSRPHLHEFGLPALVGLVAVGLLARWRMRRLTPVPPDAAEFVRQVFES